MLVWELRRGLGTVYPLAQRQGLSRKEEGGCFQQREAGIYIRGFPNTENKSQIHLNTLLGPRVLNSSLEDYTNSGRSFIPIEADIGSLDHGKTDIQGVLGIQDPWSLVSGIKT